MPAAGSGEGCLEEPAECLGRKTIGTESVIEPRIVLDERLVEESGVGESDTELARRPQMKAPMVGQRSRAGRGYRQPP